MRGAIWRKARESWPFRLQWQDCSFSLWYLLLTVAPLLVLIASGELIKAVGMPVGDVTLAVTSDTHLEAAGRLRMLATWLLLTALGIAAILYFLWTLRRFGKYAIAKLILAWIAFGVVGAVWVERGFSGTAETVIGAEALCSPLEQASGPKESATVGSGDSESTLRCGRPIEKFDLLVSVNHFQRHLLAWLAPALVLGAIACLGRSASVSLAGTMEQVDRFKSWLYLTAATFVAGLLFLSALLRWPAYGFKDEALTAYTAHSSAFVLYWGVAYSAFIAAYYVPLAALLRGQIRAAAIAEGTAADDAAGGVLDAREFLKLMVGVFAPAIAGLLGGVIKI